jgi:hypothetical protein
VTDQFGNKLSVGDKVAFAKKGRQVGQVAVGVVASFNTTRWGMDAVRIVDDATQQDNYRHYAHEILWLGHGE